jgi:hypothetical protein
VLSGRVTERSGEELTVAVLGRGELGDHVSGEVRISIPEAAA